MKRILTLTIILLVVYNKKSFSQETKILDSIFVICYQEDLNGKFHMIRDNKSKIDFFFNVKWKLHGGNYETIIFNFTFPIEKNGFWAFPVKKKSELSVYKNIYTLGEFTKALSKDTFLTPVTNGKVQIIMLYGEKCSTKFEMFPVKVGTDLSSEG